MPIKFNSNGIGAISHGSKAIASVFQGSSLVWQAWKDGELVFEGASAQSKTLTLKKGYYRVQMSGGGGQYGYCSYSAGYDTSCCFDTPGDCKTASAGSGAAFYGVIYVSSDQTISVSVGGAGGSTSAFGITCGAGNSATGSAPTSASGGYVANASAGGAGSITNNGNFTVVETGVSRGGSAGTTAGYATSAGAAGVLSYGGNGKNLPAISKTSYGHGSSGVYSASNGATSSGATGGYLRIEMCKYVA